MLGEQVKALDEGCLPATGTFRVPAHLRDRHARVAQATQHSQPSDVLVAEREVAKDTGATINQVVLAWLIGVEIPMIPLVGASSVAQLQESLAAADLELTADQRRRLDAAR